MNEKIAVIVLNWNNGSDTLECLASIYQSDDSDFYVIVADNGSTDGSLSLIRQAYPQAQYLLNGENLGFAEGNNRAIRLAMKEGAKYVFLFNNDAIMAKNTLSLLRHAAEEHPNAAALGCKIFYYDQPATIWSSYFKWNPDRGIISIRTDPIPSDSKQYVYPTAAVMGCAFFARSAHLRQVGLMEPCFFLNWEEVDWCCWMQKAGFDCLYVPAAKVWHKVSSSFVGGHRGPMHTYFKYRNQLLWMERHLPLSARLRVIKKSLWPELKKCLRNFFDPERKAVSRAAFRGVRDYCLRRFGKGPAYLFRKTTK